MFRDIIPVEALSEEKGRGRLGLLPDFRLEIPSPAGEPELRLAELKICRAVKRWYPVMVTWQGGRKGWNWKEDQPSFLRNTGSHWLNLTRSTITPNLAKYDPLNGDWKDTEICKAL
jgi:hypothetical protein